MPNAWRRGGGGREVRRSRVHVEKEEDLCTVGRGAVDVDKDEASGTEMGCLTGGWCCFRPRERDVHRRRRGTSGIPQFHCEETCLVKAEWKIARKLTVQVEYFKKDSDPRVYYPSISVTVRKTRASKSHGQSAEPACVSLSPPVEAAELETHPTPHVPARRGLPTASRRDASRHPVGTPRRTHRHEQRGLHPRLTCPAQAGVPERRASSWLPTRFPVHNRPHDSP